MEYKENIKNKKDKLTFSNKRGENIGLNRNYDGISAMNTSLTKKMLTEANIDNNIIKNDKIFGCLIYKSIFNSIDKNKIKNNNNYNNHNNISNISNIKEKVTTNFISNTSNKKINKNPKYNINLKKQIQNTENNISRENDISRGNDISNENDLFYNSNNTHINNFNIENDLNIVNNNNSTGGILSNDIKYEKHYFKNPNNIIEYSNKKMNNILNDNIKDYNNENNDNYQNENIIENSCTNKKTLKYQKSEDNLNKNKFLDKQEFLKKIKEIDDLELLDGNNDNNYSRTEVFSERDIFSNNDNINNINNNNNLKNNFYIKNPNGVYTYRNKKNIIMLNNNNKYDKSLKMKSPQNSFISTTNNSCFNNIIYNKNTYNNNHINNINNINLSKEKLFNLENNMEIKKMLSSEITTSNSNNKFKKNIKGLDFNINSFYNNNVIENYNNYIMSPEINDHDHEQNYLSTLSNGEIDKSHSNKSEKKIYNLKDNKNIDFVIQNNNKNYININNNINNLNNKPTYLNNDFSKSMGNKNNNNIKMNNNKYISNYSDNYNYKELKEINEKLIKELKQKNSIINNFHTIINEYKKKNDILLEKNKQLVEDSKAKQVSLIEQIKEYQKEIYIIKNNNKYSGNSKNEKLNINIYNYNDYIKQINELKEEVEKYKKENYKLKILAIKYKNKKIINNNTNGSQSQIEKNLRNRFSSSKELDKKNDKKCYSVSKTKRRIKASSLSKKNFEEGDIDTPSDDKHISSFNLY